ncbi:alternative ribosome rescue aminoacyl-tRNA hydrolase ArfB [Marinospirillum sp.]|uniref:alternative ribosome rescue aminoacyl-tRNA hydrolase ArfB n=1 Tax=Marinospirillum sp. TaxID=2183934 RepID=UPI00286FBF0C|nr:alternative ribosome rescue aminoacyl-tRNA hydrolase ArfB [Marinospirillum sp.]MDR9468899.1 alternative ribosome rescue aminoacyl-tRNA hydrolase ArfB [Marinospirillum sp.]
MLEITPDIHLADWEFDFQPIRAQGAGGQNVNKVASAVHLRFDIRRSSLPPFYKERLLKLSDQRITQEGVIVIKAQRFRTQEMNKEDALQRLKELIQEAVKPVKVRRATRPTKGSQRRRVDQKTRRGQIKNLRGKVGP